MRRPSNRPPRAVRMPLMTLLAFVALALALAVPSSASAAPATGPGTSEVGQAPAVEQSPVAGGGNTPQPVGRPEPPRAQRIGDSLIWLWVIAVLVAGTLFAVFAGRRPTAPDGARTSSNDHATAGSSRTSRAKPGASAGQ